MAIQHEGRPTELSTDPDGPSQATRELCPLADVHGRRSYIAVADLKAQELRWVHVDPHCRANELTPSEQAMRFLQVEQAKGESAID